MNLRDVNDPHVRRRLMQVPTAFTIAPDEVTQLIEAGRRVLRQSPDYQGLLRSLEDVQRVR